jgi:hypothetical protein
VADCLTGVAANCAYLFTAGVTAAVRKLELRVPRVLLFPAEASVDWRFVGVDIRTVGA